MTVIVAFWNGLRVHAQIPVRENLLSLLQKSNPTLKVKILDIETGKKYYVEIDELKLENRF